MGRSSTALLLVAALGLAACTSDGGDRPDAASATTTGAPTTSTPTAAPDGAAPTDPPVDQAGVTADAIKVGVAVPDFDALQAGGIPNYQGDNETAFQPFFDRINDDGGIAGRRIDPVYVGFDFLSSETQDQACIKLAEDEEVFIVLYGLLAENNLCLAELHDTMVMTDQFQTTEIRARAGDTLWLQLRAADDTQVEILGSVVADSGRLDGKTIGILANGSLSGGQDGQVLQATLQEHGHESTVATTDAPEGDIVAQEAEISLFAERFAADGVDFVFDLLGGGNAASVMADAGFRPELAYSVLESTVDGSADRTVLDGAISVAPRPDADFWDDPEFRAACVEPILEDHPELEDEFSGLPDGPEQAAGERSWSNPTRVACNMTMLLKEVGELAGPGLTNDSFRAALDELGPIDLHGYGQASFRGDDKWDGLDQFHVLRYDAAEDVIATVGEPITVSR